MFRSELISYNHPERATSLMSHKYDTVIPHVHAALKASMAAGLELRVLAKGGFQSLLVAHYLGHELSKVGQGFDAIDAGGNKYEYKATNPDNPQCQYIFPKSGTIDQAIDKKTSCLHAVVFAIIGARGVERCHVVPGKDFALYAKAHFARVAKDVNDGVTRRGRPRAKGTVESRALCLTEQVVLTISNVLANAQGVASTGEPSNTALNATIDREPPLAR